MAIMLAALQKVARADAFLIAVIENTAFALAIDAIALQIADMGAKESGACAARSGDMHFDDDTAHLSPRQMPVPGAACSRCAAGSIARTGERRFSRDF
ncbi:MAG: hypothetical protein AAFN48_13175 [Pseudomonadota bacterium]